MAHERHRSEVARAGIRSSINCGGQVPRPRRCEYATESLSEDREPTCRDVAVLGRFDHVLHGQNLSDHRSRRTRAWTAYLVIELTGTLASTPPMVARRRQAQDANSGSQRERTLGPVDGPEQPGLRDAFGEADLLEPNTERSQESHE